MSAASGLRREPQQTRGQRRIEAILDAAEALFTEVGYDATTTNAIAARAHTAIGSLYQYFPNKGAILRALHERFIAEVQAVLDDSFARVLTAPQLTQGTLLDAILDPLIALHASRAGLVHIFLGPRGFGEVAEARGVMTEEILSRLDTLIARYAPHATPAHRRLVAQVIIEATKALLPLTTTANGDLRPEAIAELKRLLRSYIAASAQAAVSAERPQE